MNTSTNAASLYHASLPRLSPGTVGIVAAAHIGILTLLMGANIVPVPAGVSTLMVDIIRPEAPVEKTPAPPKPTPIEKKLTPPRPVQPLPHPVLAAQTESTAVVAEVPVVKEAPPAPAAPPAITQPRFDADYLSNPAPTYPPLSRRMGEEGKVVLRVHVEPTGRPSQVEVRTSSNSPRLDQAALDAVWRWKFVPAKRGDEPVAAWVLVPITFNLKN